MKTPTVEMPTKVLSSPRRANGSSAGSRPVVATAPATTTVSVPRVATHDQIAQRAYELWEREGRQHGNDEHYWHTAEQQLLQGR